MYITFITLGGGETHASRDPGIACRERSPRAEDHGPLLCTKRTCIADAKLALRYRFEGNAPRLIEDSPPAANSTAANLSAPTALPPSALSRSGPRITAPTSCGTTRKRL